VKRSRAGAVRRTRLQSRLSRPVVLGAALILLLVHGCSGSRAREAARPDGSLVDGLPDSGSPTPQDAGGTVMADAGPPHGDWLVAGEGGLVDLRVLPDGTFIAVRTHGVALHDADGRVVEDLRWWRQITAADFAGGRLVVADRGFWTVLDSGLATVSSRALSERCDRIVWIRGLVVCGGPLRDGFRTLYVLDVESGATLSQLHDYHPGLPLAAVPGRDQIIAGEPPEASEIRLWAVSSTHRIEPFALSTVSSASPFPTLASPPGFIGSPARAIVTSGGEILAIDPCEASEELDSCFAPRGHTGGVRRPESERYHFFDNADDGRIYGIIGQRVDSSAALSGRICGGPDGCRVHQIEPETGAIEHDVRVDADLESDLVLRYDPSQNRVLVGASYECWSLTGCASYRVMEVRLP
jgi:hypothetical protein